MSTPALLKSKDPWRLEKIKGGVKRGEICFLLAGTSVGKSKIEEALKLKKETKDQK